MKIALVGYGKMGKAIEKTALARGHRVVSIIDVENTDDFRSAAFKSADVAIEFSAPSAAFDNYMQCFAAGVPVVAGTTGWLERLDEIKAICKNEGKTFFYASNYSIGVNIFFTLNKYLAKLMNDFPAYDVRMSETHHIHKQDAPSGTAITLAEDLIAGLDRKRRWTSGTEGGDASDIVIESVREGETPGIHEVVYESEVDYIRIKHSAKSRAGFALGAVLAAEFTVGKKGFLGMDDLLQPATGNRTMIY
ncbi:MAG: 4-hydroxy-tetrahydrodipicolinate reductase [Tannerella sp.]|jgi:4-hydroxy-tetrahydrodipicolinate reductase|nr:4-hydroxy-tetrahydrodipicolinate reductase [Tannerella sp.]